MPSWILPMILFIAGFLIVFYAPMIYCRWKEWRDYRLALRMAEKLGRSLGLIVATNITKDWAEAMKKVAQRIDSQTLYNREEEKEGEKNFCNTMREIAQGEYSQRNKAYKKASKLARKEKDEQVH